MRQWFKPPSDQEPGNFGAANDELLSLFSDPDARGSRSWRETFGYECAPRRPARKLLPITACAMPKSSSDS